MSRFHHPSPRMRQNMVSSSTASSVQQAPISDASVLDRVTQWDPGASHCLAPLASSALESVELLKRTKVDRPRMHVPRQQVNSVSSDVDVLSSPSSPLCHLPATVVEGVFAHLESGEGKIETAQQFLTWYVEVEREMTDEEDAEFREFLRELQAQWEQCNGLMDEVDSCLRLLADLKDRHLSVTEKTDRLHSASENLVAEQASLSKRLALIETHLAPFITAQELEPRITSAMDAGMASLSMAVQGAAFIPMLQKLDESISHMVQHPNFKESGSYLTKLRHLQYQALAMIRAYVCHALRLAAEAAYQQRPESLDAAFPAFYGKFRSCAPRIKGFMAEMERRAKPGEDNAKLLADVHDMYFDFRDRLLRPLFTRRLNDLSASHQRDHCTVVRAGCNNLIRICLDEHDLYFQFFNEPSEAFLTFILNLGSVLYDLLRPIFLRMSHLETLSEVCSILRIEMIEEQVAENRESLAPFETLCLQMLQDVQERLVYVTHIYIRSDILGFQPSPGDLAYPQKLEMMKSIAESLPEGENPGGGRSPCDLHGMWYPTVRRTLVCLSKLFRCLDREAFQGLSQEALEMCIQSLLEGTKGIARRIDGHLFLIKHLLILREQIAPFQVEFAVKETSLDFGKVKDAALELFHKRRMLFSFNSNNALLEFLLDGTPQVKDKIADSRQNVDSQLKIACREFIVMASRDACGPLLSFLDKADTFLSMEESQEAALPRQPYATPEALREVVGESTRVLKEKLPKLLSSLALYLANKDTEGILFRPIQANILGAYQRMQEILRKHYHEEEEIRLIACPSVEQISLLISTMTESFTSTATSARKPPRPIPTTRDSQRQGEGAAVVTENGVRASHVANGPNQKNEVQ